jgi:hypothetical protein
MPTRSPNVHFSTLLTPAEIEAVEAEARARKASLSEVVDAAVSALLTGPDWPVTGLTVPPLGGQKVVQRGYRISPATLALLDAAKGEHGYEYRHVVRAALVPLVRKHRP